MKIKLTILFMTFAFFVSAQDMLLLYPDQIPNSKNPTSERYQNNIPELYIYKPENNFQDKAVIILPGGGYAGLAMKHEGHDVAKRFADNGYVAVVLKYRIPSDEIMIDKRIGPIQDAQNALKFIRENKQKLGLKFKEIGVMGFSAGGHLASTLSTHFEEKYIDNPKKTSLRPDFSVLLYPVISMDAAITHEGSKKNLIGPDYQPEDVERFSNELRVNKNTPPTYLMHAKDDDGVKIINSERYIEALNKYGVKNKFYVYEKGGHGFGMINKHENGDWFADLIIWLKDKK